MFLGNRVWRNLARLSADGYRAEGKSFADAHNRAKLRLALMEKYGGAWAESAEWREHKASRLGGPWI